MKLEDVTTSSLISAFVIRNPVGKYVINNELTISFYTKPNFVHRLFTRLLLGWEWKDYE